MGKVALVGAGPGDIGLITVKGLKYIKIADCIIYDRLIGDDILMLSKPGCELIYVGKENHHHTLCQDEINELLEQKARKYVFVVRLKGGDPYVFGRGGEEALYLRERGIEFEVVPGISSAVAVPAYAGIPVTHRGIAKGFHVVTSHSKKDDMMDIDFSLYKDEKETAIFLMGLSHVEEIAQKLINAGRSEDTKAAVISNGTKNNQKKCVGTLKNIGKLVRESKIVSPAIIVVGEVVGLESELSFFENRPLYGKRYVVPYILSGEFSFSEGWKRKKENELIGGLEDLGATVLAVKTGEIMPVLTQSNEEDAVPFEILNDLCEKDYIIFTSKNAVNAFMWNLYMNGYSIHSIGKAKIAVVGEKTAEELKRFGIISEKLPAVATGKALAENLLPQIKASTKVLWFSGKETGNSVEDVLSDKCRLIKFVCYENMDEDICLDDENIEFISDCDGILFTSASNVRRFCKASKNVLPQTVFAIGPVCRKTLENMDVEGILEPEKSTYEDLIKLCVDEAEIIEEEGK